MNKDTLKNILFSVKKQNILYRQHAVEMMIERGIRREEVLQCISDGNIIEEYSKDKPFPSYLFSSTSATRNIHVVLAFNEEDMVVYIITAYIPDLSRFDKDFRTRRKK